MKYKLLLLLAATQLNVKSQCVANFTCDLLPNGTITLTNTSIYSGTSTPSFTWNLGDGSASFTSTSISQTLSTTYTANGSYHILLGMTAPDCFSSVSANHDTILQFVVPGCPLTASMAAINSGTGTATVNFMNFTTGTVSGTTYTWNFGDGNTSNLPTPPTHIYGKNGVYGYSLNVSNNSTCNAFFYSSIADNISNLNGTAVEEYTVTVSYSVGLLGLTTFTIHKHVFNTGFSDIHFGDGVWNQSAGVDTVFSHVFYNGVHTPTIQIYGYMYGPRSPVAGPITITNNPCYMTSAFTYTTLSGGAVQFSAPQQAHNKVKYFWDFGEGGYYSSFSPNPTHTYGSAGSFSVQLLTIDTTNFSNYQVVFIPYQSPCEDRDTINVNITNIPCIANSNFGISPSGIPHEYYIYPAYPYNVTMANWNWGDGTSYTGNSIFATHTYSNSGYYNICLTVTTSCGTSTTTCLNQYFAKGTEGDMVKVTVIQPTVALSVAENDPNIESINIFPNPSSGLLFVSMKNESEIKEFEVINTLGQSVLKEKPNDSYNRLRLDISQFADGVYFLNIKTETQQFRSKFVLEK